MRLHVLSDLHHEVAPYEAAAVDCDVVVLAGDIANGTAGIEWAQRSFRQPVLYIPGNHEYFDGEFESVRAAMGAASEGSNVRLLDAADCILGGVRFLGCTLWTDYTLASEAERPAVVEAARTRNPDYVKIRHGEGAFQPEHAIALCRRQRAWLERKLAERYSGTTVVITHFAPHPRSIAPAFATHPANPGFVLDLEALMGGPALWIHGHTHTAFDYEVRSTRVVCNPRGYPHESTGFRPDARFSV